MTETQQTHQRVRTAFDFLRTAPAIIIVVANFAGGVWFAAKFDSRVEKVEDKIIDISSRVTALEGAFRLAAENTQKIDGRVAIAEERISTIYAGIKRIEDKLDGLTDRRSQSNQFGPR